MDALQVLEEQGYNRFEETLPSGLTVTLQLPRIRDCIRAGRVPLPVLKHVAEEVKKDEGDQEIADDEIEALARFQNQLVLQSVIAIEGRPVEMSLDAVGRLRQEDYDRIVGIAGRDIALPKDRTPASSPTSPSPALVGPSLASSNGSVETPQDSSSPSTTS